MIIRISQKLAKKIKIGNLSEMPLDENPYADWSAHLFTESRKQYIILSNTKSLYSFVMNGQKITDDLVFLEGALDNIQKYMEKDGLEIAYRKLVVPSSNTVTFAKALNRSVIGSMNELVMAAKWHLSTGMAPQEVDIHLNETPMSAIDHQFPSEAFRALTDE